jgi:hypothetical protein
MVLTGPKDSSVDVTSHPRDTIRCLHALAVNNAAPRCGQALLDLERADRARANQPLMMHATSDRRLRPTDKRLKRFVKASLGVDFTGVPVGDSSLQSLG